MAKQAGLKDGLTSHSGIILTGAATVFIEDRPAARGPGGGKCGDCHRCDGEEHGMNHILEGSDSVYVEDQPLARVDDHCECGALLSANHAQSVCSG